MIKNLLIPGISGTSIKGTDISKSKLYYDAISHGGTLTYVIIKLLNYDATIGISKKGSIYFYNKLDIEDKSNIIINKLLSIILNNV